MRKGYASEYFVMSDLANKGFIPCPATQSAAGFDLIAVKGKQIDKVQVKCGNRIGQRVKVDIRKSKAAGRKYTDEDFDVLAVVDLTDWKIAYLPKRTIGDAVNLTLWVDHPSSQNGFGPNRQPKLFSDYEEYPI
jgi:hypothetical protein